MKEKEFKILSFLGIEPYEVFEIFGYGTHKFWFDKYGIFRCDKAFRSTSKDLTVILCNLINEEYRITKTGESSLHWD